MTLSEREVYRVVQKPSMRVFILNCEAHPPFGRTKDFSGSTLLIGRLLCDSRCTGHLSLSTFMRQIIVSFSLLALILSLASPAKAERQGVPGRRVGGGTRWTAPRTKQPSSMQSKLSAMAFASRTHLPFALRFRVLCG